MRYSIAFLMVASFACTAPTHAFDSGGPKAGRFLHLIGGARPRPKGETSRGNAQTNAPVAAPSTVPDGTLSGAEAEKLLAGNSSFGFMVADDHPYREYYAPDGTIRGKFDAGKWSVKDDTFCTTYPSQKKSCVSVRRLSSGVYAWVLDGNIAGYMKVGTGNLFDF
jgi:hypothetical protein